MQYQLPLCLNPSNFNTCKMYLLQQILKLKLFKY